MYIKINRSQGSQQSVYDHQHICILLKYSSKLQTKMPCIGLAVAFLSIFSPIFVSGCQRASKLIAIEDDVVTLNCSYDKQNVTLTPVWYVFNDIGENVTVVSNGSNIVTSNQDDKYNILDDRKNLQYNLEIKINSGNSGNYYLCGLSDGKQVNDIYDAYTVSALQHPSCSMTEIKTKRKAQRGQKLKLDCSWSASVLPFPVLVSWVHIEHPDVLNEDTLMQAKEINTATNSSQYKFNLSPEHYGDTFACVVRTETSNNTAIGCSYVPLHTPDVTITQIGKSIVGEIVLFRCNASRFLTSDMVYSWTVNNDNITKLDLNHFKIMSDNVLKIDSLKYTDNGLDIRCVVTEKSISHAAHFKLSVQKMQTTNNALGRSTYIGISVAGSVVVFIIMVVVIIIICRCSRNLKQDDANIPAETDTKRDTVDGDGAYLDLEYLHTPSTYEAIQKRTNQKKPSKGIDSKEKHRNPIQNEEYGISNDYTDLQYEHVQPKYDSVQSADAQPKIPDTGPESLTDPCYINQKVTSNSYVYDYAEPSCGIKDTLEKQQETVYANVL